MTGTGTSTRTRSCVVAAVVATGLLTLSACAKSADTTSNAASAPPSTAASASAKGSGGGVTSGVDASAAKNGQPASVQVLDQAPEQVGRQIVSTATVTVRVDDVVAAKEKARAKLVDGLGGQLFNEQTSLSSTSTSTMTFKVPPEKFDDALRELGLLGKLKSEEVKTEDVTQQAVDLDARISAAEASTKRVGDLVGRSNNVTELANLENEVQRRQAELESLRGQKRTLEARTDLATVVVTFGSDEPAAAPKTAEAKPLPGFFDGLSGGWNAFAGVMTVTGAVLGALLPFAWIAALAVAAVWMMKRRKGFTPPADA